MKRESYTKRILSLSKFINEDQHENIIRRLNKNSTIKETGCVEWNGDSVRGGYGRIKINGKNFLAHRMSYFVNKGEILKGLVIDHLCNNPRCINPNHLQVKTQKENIRRGNGICGINSRKTHCKNGHPFEGNNIVKTENGSKRCKVCYEIYKATYYLKNKEKIKNNSRLTHIRNKLKNENIIQLPK